MHKIVFLRHGQSTWNAKNFFTGWVDVPLSEEGASQAKKAGQVLKKQGFVFDIVFCSVLKRAIQTMEIVLKEMGLRNVVKRYSWRLNERHYGALQGLHKKETTRKFGKKQVKLWRRSFAVQPPTLDKNNPMYPGKDPLYKNLQKNELPLSESLQDVSERLLPFWRKKIIAAMKSGKSILVCSHGSVIRALIKSLDHVSDKAIEEINVPTGIPLVYEFDEDLKPTKHYYLAKPAKLKKAVEEVAKETEI